MNTLSKFWGGIAPEESVPMAQALEATGAVDLINVAVGTYYTHHLVVSMIPTCRQ